MLQVNTNVSALTAHRSLSRTADAQATSVERLSTGYRINRASDDPAGLVISEKLRSQIGGLRQALENTQNNINLINTAEAALQEISDILVDMRASVIFAMNSGFSIPEQIEAEQDKIDQSLVAIDRIAQSTRFAKRSLLNGDSDFKVEQSTTDRTALDDLQVRQVRIAPSQDSQTFSVNIKKLAERATVITDAAFASTAGITSLTPGGTSADFATIRITGSRGSEELNLGNTATIQDFITGINQTTSSTGVYASTYQPLPIDGSFEEVVLAGLGNQIDINGTLPAGSNGDGSVTIGVRVNGGPIINVVVTDDGSDPTGDTPAAVATDGIIQPGELEQALLNQVGAGFNVDTDANGDLRINFSGGDFQLVPAQNSRQVTVSGLAAFVDTDADGNLEIDIDFGQGTTGTLSVALAGGAGSTFNLASADPQTLMQAVLGLGLPAGVSAHFTDAGDLVFTGASLGTTSAFVFDASPNGDTGTAVTPVVVVGADTAGLTRLGMNSAGYTSSNRAVQFVNMSISAANIDSNGSLALAVAAGGSIVFSLTDPAVNPAVSQDVTVTDADMDGVITLAEFNAGLQAAAFVDATDWEAFFDRTNGLTIVYNGEYADGISSAGFAIGDDSGATGNIATFFNTTGKASEENYLRVALYSTEFGADQVIKVEDVTAATSDVGLKSFVNGGFRVSASGREGLGLFDGDTSTEQDMRGRSLYGVGKDVEGTINGLAFRGRGMDVQLVNTSIDVKFRLAEAWGQFGRIGRDADAVSFGLKNVVGGATVTPNLSGTNLAAGILDTFQFTVRQNFADGPRGNSGLRFQIRETNSATDALTVGIRSVGTTTLGMDIDPESSDASSVQRINRLMGGSLASLRTGAGNDLFQSPENALEILDVAVDQVNDLRAFLGSISRDTLQRNLSSASVALENLVGSEGQIRDIDFASETTEFARQQVLYAAGTSVLASANQIPQTLLQLLR